MGIGHSTKNYQETIQKVLNENISSSMQSAYKVTSNETGLEVDCTDSVKALAAIDCIKDYGDRLAKGEISKETWVLLDASCDRAIELARCGAQNVTITSIIDVKDDAEAFASVVQKSIGTLGVELQAELKQQPGFLNSIDNEVKAYQEAVNQNISTNQQKIHTAVKSSSTVKVQNGQIEAVLLDNSVFAVTRTLMESDAVQTASAALSAKIKTTIAPADGGLAWLLWTVLGILSVVLVAVLAWYLVRRSRSRSGVVVLE
jgi:uncharacterized membrane protein